jgi:hypothetical protein
MIHNVVLLTYVHTYEHIRDIRYTKDNLNYARYFEIGHYYSPLEEIMASKAPGERSTTGWKDRLSLSHTI